MFGVRTKYAAASALGSAGVLAFCAGLAACENRTIWAGPAGDAQAGDASVSSLGSCDGPTSCTNAPMLGVLSGDSNDGGRLVMTGQTSAWVVVRATEDISSWTGESMRLRAVLTPPKGATYELRAYFDATGTLPDGALRESDERFRLLVDEVKQALLEQDGVLRRAASLVDCTRLFATSKGAPTLDLAWGEPSDGGSANGDEDGRTIAFHIRHVSGACSAGAWTLTVDRP